MTIDIITAKRKLDNAKTQSERDIGYLMLDFGFEFIDLDRKIKNEEGKEIGEIDLTFRWKEYLFLEEVNGTKGAGTSKIDHFFSRWTNKNNIEKIREQFGLPPLKTVRIYFECTKETPKDTSASLNHHKNPEDMNKIVYMDDLEYFQKNAKIIGKWSRNDFLDFIDIKAPETSKKIDAIQFYISEQPVFAFVEKVNTLLDICYVSRRRNKDLGYQRAIDETRIPRISDEIRTGKVLAFPNSIVVSAPEKLVETPASRENCPKNLKINLPTSFCACRIVDGQHRLLAFSRLEDSILEAYSLPVIAFQGLETKEETKMFIDINSKQKRIDSNLILLLKSDFQWQDGTKEYAEKIAVKVCIKLNTTGALKEEIYTGTASEKPGSKLRLTTLVSAIVSNQLIGGKLHLFQKISSDIDEPYKKLNEVFYYLKTHLKNYYFGSSNPFFVKNKGIRILFRLLKIIEKNRMAENIDIGLEDFFKDLGEIVDEPFRKELEDYYGEGGANRAVDKILTTLKDKKTERYAKLQKDLRSLPD